MVDYDIYEVCENPKNNVDDYFAPSSVRGGTPAEINRCNNCPWWERIEEKQKEKRKKFLGLF